jgi:hypothetical protein
VGRILNSVNILQRLDLNELTVADGKGGSERIGGGLMAILSKAADFMPSSAARQEEHPQKCV